MFYCTQCKVTNNWPESILGSYGKCECCGRVGFCNDVNTIHLSPAKITGVDPATGIIINRETGEPATVEEVKFDSDRYEEWQIQRNKEMNKAPRHKNFA